MHQNHRIYSEFSNGEIENYTSSSGLNIHPDTSAGLNIQDDTFGSRIASKSRRLIFFAKGTLGSRTPADFKNTISASRLLNLDQSDAQ